MKIIKYIDEIETLLQKVKIIENFIEIVCNGDAPSEKRERHEKYIEELLADAEAIVTNINNEVRT